MSASAPKMITFGTCQICGASHQVHKNGGIARHGFSAASFNGYTRHTQACEGSNYAPLEECREALIAHAARVATYSIEDIDPRELLSYLAELLNTIKNWEPKDLTQAPAHTQDTTAPRAPKTEPAPKPEPKAAPKASNTDTTEDQAQANKRRLKAAIDADTYTPADAQGAPRVELVTLKSNAQRLKADRKLQAGDLVLVPLARVDFMGWLWSYRPNLSEETLPARILETNKLGQATAWAYVGDPIHNGTPAAPINEGFTFLGYTDN